jgi:hypothetical protein
LLTISHRATLEEATASFLFTTNGTTMSQTNLTIDPKVTKFRAEIIGKLDEHIALLTEMHDRCKAEESRARFSNKVIGVQVVKEQVQAKLDRYNEFAPIELLAGSAWSSASFTAERFTEAYSAQQSGMREAADIVWEYRH